MATATSTFGTSLRVARELAGLSFDDVVAKTEIPAYYLNRLENDKEATPEPYWLWKLAPLYGLDYIEMMKACGNLIVNPKTDGSRR